MRKIETYDRLNGHLQSWYEGIIPFLVVRGKPGLGKSYFYEDLLETDTYHLFKGRTTPIEIFKAVYDEPEKRIVFDDVGSLMKDPTCVELMKSLCDTRKQRKVQWNTATDRLEGREHEFYTSAPVLVMCNDCMVSNPDIQAVIDRADAIEFDPPKAEIIRKLRTYAEDEEIVCLLEEMPVLPSLRTYEKALAWKKSPYLDLKEELLAECGVPQEVQILTEIIHNEPDKKRWCQLYMERTNRQQRDYYNKLSLAMQLAA